MFTTLGRPPRSNPYREAGALLMSGSLLWLLLLPLVHGAEQTVAGFVDPVHLVETVLMDSPDLAPALPEAPAPAGWSAEPHAEEPEPPAASAALPVPAEPDPASEPALEGGPGPESGPPGPGTGPPGPGTGPPGPGTGRGDGGVRSLSWSQVRPLRRVEPRMPEAARALGQVEELCVVKMSIDEAGIPYALDLDGCPRLFHDNVRQALMKWRFDPYREEGQAKRAVFTLNLRFVQR